MWVKKLLFVFLVTGFIQTAYADQSLTIYSPDGNIQLGILHRTDGSIAYQVFIKGKL